MTHPLWSRWAFAFVSALMVSPGAAQAWTRSFVVEWFEPAFYYGGPPDGGGDTPGTDCPNGINEVDWRKALTTSYRAPPVVEQLLTAEYPRGRLMAHFGFRGANKDNVYDSPTVVPDPGFIEVSGNIAEGFNLDHDQSTGFVGPDGTKGIDNAYYGVSGCVLSWRGRPRQGTMIMVDNEGMRLGDWTTVVVLSGRSSPMNDDDVTVGVYNSKDRMVKDANGAIASDYTFRISPDPLLQTVFKGSIKNGVLENKSPIMFRTHELSPSPSYYHLALYQARVRWTLNEDGSLDGLIGGYRLFFDHYLNIASNRTAFGDTVRGGIRETNGHFSLPGWYYALRRAADGLPDPVTGANLGISTTYRFWMKPAFVVSPEGGQAVQFAQVYK